MLLSAVVAWLFSLLCLVAGVALLVLLLPLASNFNFQGRQRVGPDILRSGSETSRRQPLSGTSWVIQSVELAHETGL